MAQLAVAAAGSYVGSAVFGSGALLFGATGAQIGWTVGAMVGGVLFGPKTPDGPRLKDLSVQVSTYGNCIPRFWGAMRVAGNVIWATELVEQSSGGGKGTKGGGVQYTYRVSCAIGIGEGELCGLRRIWADGKLVYDARPENEGSETLLDYVAMRFYYGTEDQLPDAAIEADKGVGFAPAHRGLAYVVFEDLQLGEWGNRIPNLEFEVLTRCTETVPSPTQFGEDASFPGSGADDAAFYINTSTGHAVSLTGVNADDFDYGGSSEPQLQIYDPRTGRLRWYETFPALIELAVPGDIPTPKDGAVTAIGYGMVYDGLYYFGRGSPGTAPRNGATYCPEYSSSTCALPNPYAHGWRSGPSGGATPLIDQASSGQFVQSYYWPSVPVWRGSASPEVLFASSNGIGEPSGVVFNGTRQKRNDLVFCACDSSQYPGDFDGEIEYFPDAASTAIKTDGHAAAAGRDLVTGKGWISFGSTESVAAARAEAWWYPSYIVPLAVWDSGRACMWVFADTDHTLLYRNGDLTGVTLSFPGVADHVYAVCMDRSTGNLRILAGSSGDALLVLYNPDTDEIVDSTAVTPTLTGDSGRMWDYPDVCQVLYSDGRRNYLIPYCEKITQDPVYLWEVVTDLSLEAGLAESDIDVDELTDEVVGFALTRQASTRSALEQLMIAYAFDATESEGVIKFRKRGRVPVRDISTEDLGVRPAGEARVALLPLQRADERDLPLSSSVRYVNQDSDYQVGVQSSLRMVTRARSEQSIELPIVLSDAEAKAASDAWMFSAWAARTSATWSTNMKHADLEPTDVVRVDGNVIRITRRTLRGTIINWEGEFDSGAIMTSGAVAGSTLAGQTIGASRPLTQAVLLNLAALRDEDDDNGFYAATAPLSTPWSGAYLSKSVDGGSSYTDVSYFTTGATLGYTQTAMTMRTKNTIDNAEPLEVVLEAGTLESVIEAAVLNGANLAAVDDEIIQFQRATLVSGSLWRLSGLLRGRRGSRIRSHPAGARFLLLNDAAVQHVYAAPAEIGLIRKWKAVTFGGSYASAPVSLFAATGEPRMCLSPVLVGGGVNGDGDFIINWVRRSRLDAAWRDGVDAALGEASESYDVEIYDTDSRSNLLRTINATEQTATYTSAQQTTDTGGPLSAIYVRVYQIGYTLGRGYPGDGEIVT